MSDLMSKFNEGGLTSTDIEREFHPEFVSKAVIELPRRKVFFSKHNNYESMRENHGNVLTKIVHIPMLNKENLSDANVDASTAEILKNVYKVINDSTNVVVGVYNAEDYVVKADLDAAYASSDVETEVATVYATARAAAKAAATAAANAGESVFSTPGAILGGTSSYGLTAGDLVPLPEEGGVVNLLNATNKLFSAKVTKHGVGMKYTVTSIKQGSLIRTISKHIADLSRAVGELKELQSMTSVVTAAANNAIVASERVTTMSGMIVDELVDFDTFTALEQELQANDVPMDTEILTGTTNIDTVTVTDTYIMYAGRETVPMLRKIVGPDGNIAFIPLNQYKAGLDRKVLQGELGVIGSFTICIDPDLAAYRGAGTKNTVADDAEAAALGVEGITTKVAHDKLAANRHATNGYYDIFPLVVVGDDSFVETGFTYDNVKARHIMPKADVYNDMHAEVGGCSAKWSYGFLPYRPERLRMIKTLASKV
jgi:N4-gp56 family major capsid protein